MGMAYNRWLIQKDSGFDYIRIYPEISFNYFYQRFYPFQRFNCFIGLDTYLSLGSFWGQGKSGVVIESHPYLGLQVEYPLLSFRTNITPFSLAGGYYDHKWFCEPTLLALFTLYQLSFIFHNPPTGRTIFWAGARISPGALGPITGFEHRFCSRYCLRLEYSYLLPNNRFLPNSWVYDLGTIKGSVHYFTLGLFKKL